MLNRDNGSILHAMIMSERIMKRFTRSNFICNDLESMTHYEPHKSNRTFNTVTVIVISLSNYFASHHSNL